MADVYSSEKRSEIMARIRSKNTEAERMAFTYLRRNKVYFQKHYTKVAGKPDIALPRKKRAVFIDGDFWHGKTYDKVLANHSPGSYWVTKIARNMQRDREQRAALEKGEWVLLVVWENDILRKRTQQETLDKICDFLTT